MLRYCVSVFCVASLAFACAGVASAGYFADLSAMAPLDYYNAIPDGVNSSGAVSMQGYSAPTTVLDVLPHLSLHRRHGGHGQRHQLPVHRQPVSDR